MIVMVEVLRGNHPEAFLTKVRKRMFDVGKTYTVTTWEGGEDGGISAAHHDCEVIEVQLPVVKFRAFSLRVSVS